jgi:hypothetical protein
LESVPQVANLPHYNGGVTRRFFVALVGSGAAFGATAPGLSVRGKLGQSAVLDTADHKRVGLEGDEATAAVLNDERLRGDDLEAVGHYRAADRFVVDPIHTRAMFVHKDGKRLIISYWCDVCYIRTYSPGVCWCCQKYTDLDLREPDES